MNEKLKKIIADLTRITEELQNFVKPEPKLEDVRAVLADISRSGKTQQMKVLLAKYGAMKLSEVKPEDYTALLKDAEEIANA